MKGKRGPKDLRKKSLPELKRTLWDEFSEYIRRRDTDAHTGWGNCISCGEPILFGTTNCQAGHWIPKGKGGGHSLAYCEENVNAQCASCNLHEGGNFVSYERNLRLKYGDDVVDELKAQGDKSSLTDWGREEYIERIEHYREALKEM